MKVVLLTDIEKLGQTGDMVAVKAGYARNFLIPTGMAAEANSKNLKQLETQRKSAASRALREMKTHQALAARLSKCTLTTRVKVGEEDKMFGAVTSANITELLAEQGIEIDRRIIDLPEPIKALGVYTVPVKIHANVEAHVTVKVIKED
jgi:large subunit ribosomal protein L9